MTAIGDPHRRLNAAASAARRSRSAASAPPAVSMAFDEEPVDAVETRCDMEQVVGLKDAAESYAGSCLPLGADPVRAPTLVAPLADPGHVGDDVEDGLGWCVGIRLGATLVGETACHDGFFASTVTGPILDAGPCPPHMSSARRR